MRAVAALVHTIVAISPLAFVAVVTLPVATIRPLGTYLAKDAGFESLGGVLLTLEYVRCRCAFSEWSLRSSEPMAAHDVGIFVIRRITTGWGFVLVCWPGRPSKSIPMFATFPPSIASLTKIERPFLTARAVVVQVILDVILPAATA